MKKMPSGFTLIELMIAILIGIILMFGIATLFTNTTNNIRLQRGIANIQENGRIISEFFKQEVSGVGSQYCATLAAQPAIRGYTPRRPFQNNIPLGLMVKGNDDNLVEYTPTATGITGGTFYGLPGPADHPLPSPMDPMDERTPGLISARFTIQGHDCVGTSCTPALTVLGAARMQTGATAAPANASLNVGDRVPGSDVLSFRTLVGAGASVNTPVYSGANIVGYTLAPQALQRLRLNNVDTGRYADRLLMVTDCNSVSLFRGTVANDGSNILGLAPGSFDYGNKNNARVFDMENQWLTITYYLQYVADPNSPNRIIPALMRRENGRDAEELARGIERLDFRYSVVIGDSSISENSRWLTADQVQSRNGGTIACPTTSAFGQLDDFGSWDPTNSCLWTSVRAIEVGFSATSIDQLAFSDDQINYTMENQRNIATTDRMLHREFRVFIPLKAWAR